VKLYQAACLLKAVEEASGYGDIPVIICGDLNSLPDSQVVEFLKTGGVGIEGEERRGLG